MKSSGHAPGQTSPPNEDTQGVGNVSGVMATPPKIPPLILILHQHSRGAFPGRFQLSDVGLPWIL